MAKYIDTVSFSMKLREQLVKPETKQILIARLSGSQQEADLTIPVNCQGYGRIRHFKFYRYPDWSSNPLPIVPATRALGVSSSETIRAQVFQNSACNWRCWYCYVDFSLLSADLRRSEYFTAKELIQLYLDENDRPNVIDISGGQPDLSPEWTLWIMEAIQELGLANQVYLWSDDNLSTRYFWKYLSKQQREYIANFPKYSRVGCFKGYDENSFSFNTLANPEQFRQQFEIFRDFLNEGLDIYAYVTLTAVPHSNFRQAIARFVDQLQAIHPNLPLRTIPLKIEAFTPTQERIRPEHEQAIRFQYDVHNAWIEEVGDRFTDELRKLAICDVNMKS